MRYKLVVVDESRRFAGVNRAAKIWRRIRIVLPAGGPSWAVPSVQLVTDAAMGGWTLTKLHRPGLLCGSPPRPDTYFTPVYQLFIKVFIGASGANEILWSSTSSAFARECIDSLLPGTLGHDCCCFPPSIRLWQWTPSNRISQRTSILFNLFKHSVRLILLSLRTYCIRWTDFTVKRLCPGELFPSITPNHPIHDVAIRLVGLVKSLIRLAVDSPLCPFKFNCLPEPY